MRIKRASAGSCSAAVAAAFLWTLASWTAASSSLKPVHVAFLTDCTMYSNWMSLTNTFSFKMSGQPGKVTRVMCCTPEEKANYPKELLQEVCSEAIAVVVPPHACLVCPMRALKCDTGAVTWVESGHESW